MMRRHPTSIALPALLVLSFVGCTEEAPDATLSSQEAPAALDVEALQAAAGAEGEENDGEWKWTVPQNDLDVGVDGFRIVPPMGLGSWAAFTPAPEGAAVMGDIVLLEEEVRPVQQRLLAKALAAHDIEVVVLHNHMIHEEPRIFFLHYWGVGPAEELARGLRAALDQTGTPRAEDP